MHLPLSPRFSTSNLKLSLTCYLDFPMPEADSIYPFTPRVPTTCLVASIFLAVCTFPAFQPPEIHSKGCSALPARTTDSCRTPIVSFIISSLPTWVLFPSSRSFAWELYWTRFSCQTCSEWNTAILHVPQHILYRVVHQLSLSEAKLRQLYAFFHSPL